MRSVQFRISDLTEAAITDIETIAISEAEAMHIKELHRLVRMGKATLTSPDGLHQLELPDPLYVLLLRIIGDVLAPGFKPDGERGR